MRETVFGRIAASTGMDLSEAEKGVEEYRTFGDLFIRRLQPGRRTVDPATDAIISPVDGCISALGSTSQGTLIQAKGISYSLIDLLEDEDLAAQLKGGTFITIYLRPKDYHRIHSPQDGRVVGVRRIPGTLFPVKPYVVRNIDGLFRRNERVVIQLQTDAGIVALVCVAAAGVGNITLAFDERQCQRNGRQGVAVDKGMEVAAFNLGSTVILIHPPDSAVPEPLQPGQEVRMGQLLARCISAEKPART